MHKEGINMNDTIAAISTSLGVGAISIVRLSGPEAIKIANKIFDKDLTNQKTHTILWQNLYMRNRKTRKNQECRKIYTNSE